MWAVEAAAEAAAAAGSTFCIGGLNLSSFVGNTVVRCSFANVPVFVDKTRDLEKGQSCCVCEQELLVVVCVCSITIQCKSSINIPLARENSSRQDTTKVFDMMML